MSNKLIGDGKEKLQNCSFTLIVPLGWKTSWASQSSPCLALVPSMSHGSCAAWLLGVHLPIPCWGISACVLTWSAIQASLELLTDSDPKSHLLPTLPDERKTRQEKHRIGLTLFLCAKLPGFQSELSVHTISSSSAEPLTAGNPLPLWLDVLRHQTTSGWFLVVAFASQYVTLPSYSSSPL